MYQKDFWQSYPDARAAELAAFLTPAKQGRPIGPFTPPAGTGRQKAEQDYQLAELERSLGHCRNVLGLGVRPATG